MLVSGLLHAAWHEQAFFGARSLSITRTAHLDGVDTRPAGVNEKHKFWDQELVKEE